MSDGQNHLSRSRVNSHQESVVCPWVIVQHDPGRIANDLKRQSQEQAYHEAPCSVEDAQHKLRYDEDAEEYGEEEIAAKRRSVCETRLVEAATIALSARVKMYTFSADVPGL
jgi:hypothetical protein